MFSFVSGFHFHKYSEWSRPVQTYSGNKQQWCRCKICNKAKFRTLSWDKQTSLVSIIQELYKDEQDTTKTQT